MLEKNSALLPFDRGQDFKSKKWIISIDHESPTMIFQFSFTFHISDLFQRFAASSFFPKVFIQERESPLKKMSLGSLIHWDRWPTITILNHEDDQDELQWFLMHPFSKESDTYLDKSESPQCFIPLILFQGTTKHYRCDLFFAHLPTEEEIDERLGHLMEVKHFSSEAPLYHFKSRIDLPNRASWEDLVQKTVNHFHSDFKKVVLARSTTWDCDEPLDPYHLLSDIAKEAIGCTVFAVYFSDSHAFLGATPENLYIREGKTIKTESIAGTRSRGKTFKDDFLLETELLSSFKDNEEFTRVKDWIQHRISHLCVSYKKTSPFVKKYSHFQHIFCGFEGILHESINDPILVATLHPTPALGGDPQDQALHWIHKHENFSRGYYGAPLGFISQSRTYLSISIRSAWVIGNTLKALAGCGIVSDSKPQDEWEELDIKISPFQRYLC